MLVGTRFQVLFHSPPGVLFTFPSRYCSTIGHQLVFRLGGWSPRLPTAIPRVPWYSGYALHSLSFAYEAFTLCGRLSQAVRLDFLHAMCVLTPRILLLSVWPPPRSLATTCGISVDFSSSPYLDVSVQVVPFIHLCLRFQCMIHRYCLCGLPHSDICGSMRICHSPQLFAACHVLLRLLVPRHSPCALFCLTFVSVIMWVLFLRSFVFASRSTKL